MGRPHGTATRGGHSGRQLGTAARDGSSATDRLMVSRREVDAGRGWERAGLGRAGQGQAVPSVMISTSRGPAATRRLEIDRAARATDACPGEESSPRLARTCLRAQDSLGRPGRATQCAQAVRRRPRAARLAFPTKAAEQAFAQNEAYCSKEGELTEFGTKPMGNGKKRSLEDLAHTVVEAGLNGTRLSEVVTEDQNRATFVQYHTGITTLYRHAVSEKLRKVDKAAEQALVCSREGGVGDGGPSSSSSFRLKLTRGGRGPPHSIIIECSQE